MSSDQFIEREAKLFEAGSYPDRGIEITDEDLDRIVEGTGTAPVRIEHTDTPFDSKIGFLKSLYRRGRELFGTLSFTRAAWELIKSANARRLSVAIRKDKSGIAEVSLVREPRVADAAVFSSDDALPLMEIELPDIQVGLPTSELGPLDRAVEAAIDDLKRAGKIVPASETFARALLACSDDSVITFGGESTPVSRVFRWFLEAQPKVIEFAELAAAEPEAEEPEIFAKLGITSRQVERYRER